MPKPPAVVKTAPPVVPPAVPVEAPVEDIKDSDEGEYIVAPGAVKANQHEEVALEEPKEEEAAPETEAEEVVPKIEESTVQPEATEAPAPETIPPAVDDDENKALEIGRQVKEYQKTHPGFDPFILHREFTQRSMELAEYKKKYGDVNTPAPVAPSAAPATYVASKSPEAVAAEAGVDPETVKQFSKIASSLGFVSKDELARQELDKRLSNYEAVKQAQVAKFFEKYPQYHPTKDPTNVNWNKILGEYGIYKVPEDATKIFDLLERAHRSVSGPNIIPKSMKKIIAQKEVNKVGAATGGGSGGGGTKSVDQVKRAQLAAGLKGFSQEELDELAS